MKKVLLGTMALVAAGAFAGIGAAQADDMMGPISVGVGGYYNLVGISYDQDGADDRGHGFQQNIEIEVGGETTLDNGITAGIRIRITGNNWDGMHDHPATAGDIRELNTALEVQSGQDGYVEDDEAGSIGDMAGGDDDNVSETEVFFKGAFGALHLGMIEGATQQMTVWAPGGAAWGGIKSPYFAGIGGMWTTHGMDEDSTKLVYFSPTLNGISFGVSYAPKDTNHSYAGRADNESTADTLKHGEQVTAAVSYSTDVMGGSFSANFGHETNSTESMKDGTACDAMTMNCDPEGMRYGATVSIDQISLGVAIYEYDSGANMETTHTDAGVGWSEGPLSLGVQYGSNDMGATENNITTFNASYNLGPGIDVGAQFGSGEKWNKDAGMHQDFTQFVLGTTFSF